MENWLDEIPPLRSPRKPKKEKPKVPDWCKQRYIEAHQLSFSQAVKDAGHTFKATMPDCSKSGGLTQAIIKFLNWSGNNADRTGTEGRMIKVKGVYKRIKSANRKGTSDISATIKGGKSVKLEIKIKPDKPSPEQLREQERERSVGGCYEFIYSFEEFLLWYDNFLNSIK